MVEGKKRKNAQKDKGTRIKVHLGLSFFVGVVKMESALLLYQLRVSACPYNSQESFITVFRLYKMLLIALNLSCALIWLTV